MTKTFPPGRNGLFPHPTHNMTWRGIVDAEGNSYEQYFCATCRREKVTELVEECPGYDQDDRVVNQDDKPGAP